MSSADVEEPIMGAGSIPAAGVDSIPDELLQACFARLPLRGLGRLRAVCKRWQRLADAGCLYLLRKALGLTQPCAYMLSSKYDQGLYTGLHITGAEIVSSALPPPPPPNCRAGGIINDAHLTNLRSVSLLEGPPRLQFSATAAADGRLLYILGGRSPLISRHPDTWIVFRRVDVYDTVLNKWLQATPMQAARYAFAVGAFTCAQDGLPRLVVAGGYDAQGHALASAELYNAAADEWHSLPSMNSLSGACKGEFTRGKFYVKMANNGPRAIEAFDPSLLRWVSPNLSSPQPAACPVEQEAAESGSTNKLLAFDTSPGVIVLDL